ncbi:MAG: hypothetical protein HYS27_16920 [Deltaproteobacteria bacterium]|nr:hypothetical protein [Deltaproteobacteria bacterium]
MQRWRTAAPVHLLAALLAMAGGVALAQGAADAPKGDTPEAPAREDAADDPAAQVAPGRYVDVAQENVGAMRVALSKGLEELKMAREKRDAVELTCVNENVTAMKGILRVAEDSVVALQEAMSANDSERGRYEFRKIHVSKRKMDELLTAAINCAGADVTSSNTSVTMEVDPDLANIDPYYGDTSFFFDPTTALVEGSTGIVQEEDPPNVRPPNATTTI